MPIKPTGVGAVIGVLSKSNAATYCSFSPRAGRSERKRSRSRGAIFVRARAVCPTMLLTASPLALCPGFPCARPRPQTKGKRNAERRVVTTRALRARGAPLRRRSPLGVPPRLLPGRQLVPKALHQAMLRETVRSARSYGPPTGARIVRISTGVTRAGKLKQLPRTVSTSRTGHDTGRLMPDAARERVTNPPAGTALAPSQGVSSRRTSLRKARWSSFSSAGGLDTRNSGGACHPFDATRFFFICLFDSRSVKYGIVAMIRIFPVKARKARRFLVERRRDVQPILQFGAGRHFRIAAGAAVKGLGRMYRRCAMRCAIRLSRMTASIYHHSARARFRQSPNYCLPATESQMVS